MGLLPVYTLVSPTERTDTFLDIPDEIEDHPLLVISGMQADRAQFAYFRQSPVKG